MTTLIIAATDLEISWLASGLQARPDRPLLDFPVYHAADRTPAIRLITSGPGMANAAAACAAAIERYRPERICNVGICGVYSKDKTLLGKAAIGTQALFADTGAAGDTGFESLETMGLPLACPAGTNIFNAISLGCEAARHDSLRADFLTVAGVSGSPAMATNLSVRFTPQAGTLLCEDMESAAVALIALRAGIPCTVIRGISNICGQRDHAHWKIREAAQAAQELLLEILHCHESTT